MTFISVATVTRRLQYPMLHRLCIEGYRREAYFRSSDIIGCISDIILAILFIAIYSKLYHEPRLYGLYNIGYIIWTKHSAKPWAFQNSVYIATLVIEPNMLALYNRTN